MHLLSVNRLVLPMLLGMCTAMLSPAVEQNAVPQLRKETATIVTSIPLTVQAEDLTKALQVVRTVPKGHDKKQLEANIRYALKRLQNNYPKGWAPDKHIPALLKTAEEQLARYRQAFLADRDQQARVLCKTLTQQCDKAHADISLRATYSYHEGQRKPADGSLGWRGSKPQFTYMKAVSFSVDAQPRTEAKVSLDLAPYGFAQRISLPYVIATHISLQVAVTATSGFISVVGVTNTPDGDTDILFRGRYTITATEQLTQTAPIPNLNLKIETDDSDQVQLVDGTSSDSGWGNFTSTAGLDITLAHALPQVQEKISAGEQPDLRVKPEK